MFLVKAGTPVYKLDCSELGIVRHKRITCKADVLFGKHEVTVDPVGKLGHTNVGNMNTNGVNTIGADFCRKGYIGFEHEHNGKRRTIFVAYSQCEYLD